MTLQSALDYNSQRLSVQAPIVATPGLLKLTLALGFRLEHRDELGSGFHQFRLGEHTSAARKLLKSEADKYQVIVGGGAAPSLSDATTLTAPDGVSLPVTLVMLGGDTRG